MIDFSQFDKVFGPMSLFAYNRTVTLSIEASRRSLEGSLFIDRVLKALKLGQATNCYPPKNEAALRELHQHICDSDNINLHHKLSIIYYLLLDIDGRSSDGDSKADSFASLAGIPQRYQVFMKGLWLLDTRNFELALEHLTHPALISDFTDEILVALVRHAKDDDYTLALSYYHTVQPNIQSSAALQALFEAIARSSVIGGFDFSRSHADYMRRSLFQNLVAVVLDAEPDEDRASRAYELTSLPFDADEERWFREYLESGEGKKLKAAKDTLVMRRIATGHGGYGITGGDKGGWATVLEGFRTGSGGRTPA
ncbi:putative nuclear pore complex assembly protein [Rosellinia necatrix]|uniref:Putative nuclear pore complex assembly protein n=1 Tax=Rosellinia necatrix TaxID=77044 RepID=A0A1W2TVF8_ROSNE|nr:putative nuclear pore complex assembly protein [Rosellinia necatrix]